MKTILPLLMIATLACSQSREDKLIGYCEDCALMFDGMPDKLSWKTSVATSSEPGEPLIMSGIIYKEDGKIPASGVILYVYHTDNNGLYSPAPDQTFARRHGHLRGWMQTDERGRYEFKTIRPAAYPNRQAPQHIHPIINEPGKGYYWIDEYWFEDDSLLTEQEKSRAEKRGGSGLIKLEKNEKGVWIGKRNIVLGLNIPSY